MRAMSNVAAELALLGRENSELKATVVHLETLVEKLRYQLAQLTRRQFGVSAEALAQLGLWTLEEVPVAEAPRIPTMLVPTHERAKPVRRPLPDDLPRAVIEVDLAPEQQACPCCGGARHVIGEEVSEKLDIEPARMSVLQYRRKKYACRACEAQVEAAPMPAQVIEQGLATPGLLAHVAVQKFCDHMPLARQEKFFARHGIELPRSTLTDWMLSIGQATMPLVERMGEWLKRGDILASDDTPLPWQNGRAGKTTTARLWVWRGLVEDCNRCWFTSSPLIARENMRPPSSRAGKAICKPTPTADTIAILSMAASSKLDVSRTRGAATSRSPKPLRRLASRMRLCSVSASSMPSNAKPRSITSVRRSANSYARSERRHFSAH